ncbi:hypothetical protein [Bradyrhizobium sp. Ai1a-2]|uniref:hypothetical protein n=1 Tax=Bradyrhizobium sp. Ai1a-2 TaxID=196490 RepID=UPI0003F8CE85|nr:hypothetical protein [Bradyrhizobium sp. Ai1a-2]
MQLATFRTRLGFWLPIAVACAAILFLFIMMQLSAITYPFWDHWEQAETISIYYEKGLGPALWHVLTSLSQHTRPVTVRLIFLLNGILTRWDIGSEYIYMYMTLAAGLLLHFRIIRRIAGTKEMTASEAMLFSVVTILYCSPANHNNHWWSWMLQLNLNAVLSLVGLYVSAFEKREWTRNILMAIVCWLSVYTLTNGLFLLLTMAFIAQFRTSKPLLPGKVTVFWLANIAAILWTYFPIAEPGMTAHPQVMSVVQFALMYIGQPVAALINFPYYNMFEPPFGTMLSTLCGTVIGLFACYIVFVYRSYFRDPPPHFIFMVGTFIFVGLSALGTGWARVTFDSFGVRNGNSSRYVVTGSLFVIAMLYFAFAERRDFLNRVSFGYLSTSNRTNLAIVAAYTLFVLVSCVSYVRSFPIYSEVRAFNFRLASGFAPDGRVTPTDPALYPNATRMGELRSRLLRLRIGPYRGDPVQAP